jgi:galactose mutarotase-like enzyme
MSLTLAGANHIKLTNGLFLVANCGMNLMNMAESVAATDRVVRDGFDVRFLRNSVVELAVVPELGAKVVSLKNLRTGREWMYRAGEGVKLFRNQHGDDFSLSPLVGWDECLPTIIPCAWRGRDLPDHGEVWSAAWQLCEEAWEQGLIKTSVQLPLSPFAFTRTLNLREDTLNVDYHLVNLSGESQEYLWIMHPLLALHPGDRLVLSPEIRGHLRGQAWLDSLDFPGRREACAKAFAGPLQTGKAEIRNDHSADRLILTWDATDCHMLGIWLTRGGWNGHHHVALEPAIGGHDSLAEAVSGWQNCGSLPPHGEKKWKIQIQLPAVAAL